MLRLKQSANADGAVRFQCPAAGTSPSLTCPRFDRLHQRGSSRPTAIDLTDARQRAAHPNGRPKGHDLDLGDPKNRLAHGRVAQTILVTLLVTVANDHFLDQWRHTHQPQNEPVTPADTPQTPAATFDGTPPAGQSRPPPAP